MYYLLINTTENYTEDKGFKKFEISAFLGP